MRCGVNGENNMNSKKIRLSVIVLAKNEQERIARCLDALSFAEEIIVLDNNSTDKTSEIAVLHGARVEKVKSDNFAAMRNEAADFAKGSWMLYVDADEIVSPELAGDIKNVVSGKKEVVPKGFEIYRKNYYLGKEWPTGEWMLRLFRKDSFQGWFGSLHESPRVLGSIGKLTGNLVHDTHRNLSEMVEKTNQWSATEAELRLVANHPPVVWWRILRVAITGFWDSFIRQRGWRAGSVGWIESMYQGFSMFITYAKLWELQQQKHS